MSKYNLTDIFEQYRIGSGYTRDFDYDGMLNTGLGTSIDTPIEVLKKISDDFEDVNYHRENNHLQMAIDAIEIGDMMEAEGRFSDFHAEIRKTMETFGMDMSDDLGAFMASKMEEDYKPSHRAYNVIDGKGNIVYKELPRHTAIEKASEREDYGFIATDNLAEDAKAVNLAIEASQEKAGIKEDKYDDIVDADGDIPADKKKEAAAAYRKVDKGASYEKATSHIKEDHQSLPIEVSQRIEGLLNIPMKKKFMDAGMDLIQDLLDDEVFDIDDIISHLANELSDYLDGFYKEGDRLAGLEENKEIDYTLDPYEDRDEIIKQVMSLLIKEKGASKEELKGFIETHMEDILNAGDDDDIVDEFTQYLSVNESDIALREHFGRFMKDYQ